MDRKTLSKYLTEFSAKDFVPNYIRYIKHYLLNQSTSSKKSSLKYMLAFIKKKYLFLILIMNV